jgi:hypothetical protein
MNKILWFIISLIVVSCVLSEENTYEITLDGIKSNGNIKLQNFTIALFDRTENQMRPYSTSKELARYCFEFDTIKKSGKTVSFTESNIHYKWSRCDLDLSYVETDSLKSLTLKQKLDLIHQDTLSIKIFNKMPFVFSQDTLYHVFGLDGIVGSYYIALDKDNSIVVDYFDGGPW